MNVRFSEKRRAIAHLIVPHGEALQAIGHLIRSVGDGDGATFHVRSNPRVVQMAGPVDIIFSIEPPSFRSLFRYNSLMGELHVSCQWILCKKLILPRLPETAYDNGARAGGEENSRHCFFLHLRVLRHLYQAGGYHAEATVLEGLAECLLKHGLRADVLAATGWSDLIIHGVLDGEADKYCAFLSDVQAISAPGFGAEDAGPVFQRTVSLLGTIWTRQEDYPAIGEEAASALPAQALRFQVRPGCMPEAIEAVTQLLGRVSGSGSRRRSRRRSRDDFSLYVTTGKTDLLAVPPPKPKFRDTHGTTELHREMASLAHSGITRVETTVLMPGAFALSAKAPASSAGAAWKTPVQCTCRKSSDVLLKTIQTWDLDDSYLLIPSGIRESVSAIFSLFRCILRDEEQCCDMLRVILSSKMALAEIVDDIVIMKHHEGTGLSAVEQADWIRRYLDEIKIWCSRTEKVLEERAESFQEMFTRSTRLSSYRGNVQKYLMTADFLVDEFLDTISSGLSLVPSSIPRPILHFGATDQIESQFRGGLVTTIPSKYLFSLPLAIPQLWQEAAVRTFNRAYKIPIADTAARVTDYTTRFRSFIHSEEEEAARLRKASDGEHSIRVMLMEELQVFLADQFGDLCVRFFGFRYFIDWATFLVTLALRSPSNLVSGEGVRLAFWEDILQRLLYVHEAELILYKRRKLTPPSKLDRDSLDLVPSSRTSSSYEARDQGYFIDPAGYVEKAVRRVATSELRVNPHLFGDGRDALFSSLESQPDNFNDGLSTQIRILLENVVCRMRSPGYLQCHWQFMWDFIEHFDVPDVRREQESSDAFERDLASLRRGELVDLAESGWPLNHYFREGYLDEVYARLSTDGSLMPAGMAALGRSIFLAAYARASRTR